MIRIIKRRIARRPITGPISLPKTSIIVPVLNEADNIIPLVQRLKKAVASRRVEVLFIDDSPNNKTAKAVALARKTYRNKTFDVWVFHRTGENCWGGLSGAVSDGIMRAKSNRIIVMDGDLQHPPEIIPDMIAASKQHDLVVASRYCKGGSANGLDGRLRHLISRSSTILAKTFFPFRLRPVSDPMTGFFLFNRQVVDNSRLRPNGFKILLEILATHPKLSVAEVPLQFGKRIQGKSHGTIKQGLEFVWQLINLRFMQLIRRVGALPKFVQFGAIGGSVFGLGMVMLYLLVEILGISPLPANAAQLAVTFWLNYVLNRNVTWRNRSLGSLAVHKFLASRAATTVFSYLMFAWLISLNPAFSVAGRNISFTINYLIANVITLIAMTVLNYAISDRWAFAEQKPSRRESIQKRAMERASKAPYTTAYITIIGLIIISIGVSFNTLMTVSIFLAIASLALFAQSSMEAWRMVYTYRKPASVDSLRFPMPNGVHERFCLIVPARHESAVLADTLSQLAKQTHTDVHIITVICDDDHDTLAVAYKVEAATSRIQVMKYPLGQNAKPSKPKQLNYVFNAIKEQGYTIIGVVDAEDSVQPELLMHIDAAFRDRKIGIVQGGVQLINHDSSWYSLHNVLEYYRWFNSAMAFQADNNFMPLGGNTIFIREKLLHKSNGWPETLTEDCALGVLLSTRYKTKIAVYYEPELATLEETPDTLKGLFKQRVRWNQGFYHEWRKGVWRELPTFRQRQLASYVLMNPLLLSAISVFIPISLITSIALQASVGLVMLTYIPIVPIILLMVINAIYLHDFGKAFQRKVRIRHYVVLFASWIVYQSVLNMAALWAVVRELRGDNSWYKTPHTGKHRAYEVANMPATNLLEEEGNNA